MNFRHYNIDFKLTIVSFKLMAELIESVINGYNNFCSFYHFMFNLIGERLTINKSCHSLNY